MYICFISLWVTFLSRQAADKAPRRTQGCCGLYSQDTVVVGINPVVVSLNTRSGLLKSQPCFPQLLQQLLSKLHVKDSDGKHSSQFNYLNKSKFRLFQKKRSDKKTQHKALLCNWQLYFLYCSTALQMSMKWQRCIKFV